MSKMNWSRAENRIRVWLRGADPAFRAGCDERPRTSLVVCGKCGRRTELKIELMPGQKLRCKGCGTVRVFREGEAKLDRMARRWAQRMKRGSCEKRGSRRI